MEEIKVIRRDWMNVKNIRIGDQIQIPLGEMGEFTATAHKITDEGVLFIFDECVAQRPMNKRNTNKGGFEKSDLKEWIDTELYMAFPEWLRDRIANLSIPTIGQIIGWNEEWDAENFEPDGDQQLPLMQERKNRITYFQNDLRWGWLRNATKSECSSTYFAVANTYGVSGLASASSIFGVVRPEFVLVK